MEKCWKYLDCTMFKGKGCGSFGLSSTNAIFSISGIWASCVQSWGDTERKGWKWSVCHELDSSTSGMPGVALSVATQEEIGLVGQDGNSCAEIQRKSAGWLSQAFPGDSLWHNPGQAICPKKVVILPYSGKDKHKSQRALSFRDMKFSVFKVCFMLFITPLIASITLTDLGTGGRWSLLG